MLVKSVEGSVRILRVKPIGARLLTLGAAAAALLAVAGCSTPCDAPGGLCAPLAPITRAPLPPAPPAAPPRMRPAEPAPEAETFAVADPNAIVPDQPGSAAPALVRDDASNNVPARAAGAPLRIALLLPLRSESLGAAAASLRAGFMAGYEHDRNGVRVSVIETGDSSQDTLASYAAAQDQNDVMVGPLARSAVTALAASALVRKPTIALNHPEGRGTPTAAPLPPQMLVVGLSIEDEARQVAKWAGSAYPGGSALILSAGAPWQRRIADAFGAQWQSQGYPQLAVEMSALNGYLSDAELVQLRARLQDTMPSLLFLAMDADQARQLRVALGPLGDTLPVYGTAALNPGPGNAFTGPELNNVRLLDLPWQVQRDHPAVMVYPQPVAAPDRKASADMDRLYALGIDAYRVAREVGMRPGAAFTLDGVTGKLAVRFDGNGAQFERSEQPAIYQNGSLLAIPPNFETPAAAPALLPAPAPAGVR